MIGGIMMGVGLFLLVIGLLNALLPNFKRQNQLNAIATLITMNELDRERSKQGHLTRYLTKHTKGLGSLDYLLGETTRRMYLGLGKKESYEVYIINHLITSIALGTVPLMVYTVFPQKLFVAAAPVLAGLFFYTSIMSIKNEYNKRQKLLIRDLPNMISKMIIALEVGRPLNNIFREISEHKQTSPLLSQMLKRLITDSREMSLQDALDKFANEVDLPVVYDFTSVVNVVIVRGFDEAEKDLNAVKDDLRDLRYISLGEQTRKEPGKMIRGYLLLGLSALLILGSMIAHIFGSFASIN
ncbi:hypothetical protein [Paenibacillus bovis]|uniref:Type II secretion system protein GspF domain-containing protein n=1 Tax=Paenibacillus bovis TaxID=1616788 RepID=A0A1X9T4E6_9BACL|nr:hypothetical protein [Paenibacillus bovis]ARR10739.1 hypothetical protein AR543_p0131 [Paenibacillus bovis]